MTQSTATPPAHLASPSPAAYVPFHERPIRRTGGE